MTFLHSKQPDFARGVLHRICGYRPPRSVMKRIHRHHPTCTLLWEPTRARWVLVQRDQAQTHVIRVLQGPDGSFEAPNLYNTVGYLDSVMPSKLEGRFGIDRFLQERITDEVPDDPVVERRIENNIHEYADRLWHLSGRSVSAVPNPRRRRR